LDGALVSLELENNVACFMPQTWESPVRRLLKRMRVAHVPARAHVVALRCAESLLRAQTTQRVYDRIVDGIASVLLTLKKRPVIRYSQTCV
jgi:hypothetical protein